MDPKELLLPVLGAAFLVFLLASLLRKRLRQGELWSKALGCAVFAAGYSLGHTLILGVPDPVPTSAVGSLPHVAWLAVLLEVVVLRVQARTRVAAWVVFSTIACLWLVRSQVDHFWSARQSVAWVAGLGGTASVLALVFGSRLRELEPPSGPAVAGALAALLGPLAVLGHSAKLAQLSTVLGGIALGAGLAALLFKVRFPGGEVFGLFAFAVVMLASLLASLSWGLGLLALVGFGAVFVPAVQKGGLKGAALGLLLALLPGLIAVGCAWRADQAQKAADPYAGYAR